MIDDEAFIEKVTRKMREQPKYFYLPEHAAFGLAVPFVADFRSSFASALPTLTR